MYYINNRFCVDPSSNLLTDLEEKRDTRLEPRIMELLCMLTDQTGKTITREHLVTSIWKDYGGGDDGLTQAISTLRKVLDDQNKELIQTIPKKGYSFNGKVSQADQKNPKKIARKWITVAIVILLVIPTSLLVFRNSRKEQKKEARFTEIAFPTNNAELDQSELDPQNTIGTTGPDGAKYRLVMIGDQPPRFYINDSIIPVHKWDPYMPLINKLKMELKEANQAKEK